MFRQTAEMLTCHGASTGHIIPSASSNLLQLRTQPAEAGAYLKAEQLRAEQQPCAHRSGTSVQEAQAAKASYSVSRQHTHKGITASTSNVTKLRLSWTTVFKRGIFYCVGRRDVVIFLPSVSTSLDPRNVIIKKTNHLSILGRETRVSC